MAKTQTAPKILRGEALRKALAGLHYLRTQMAADAALEDELLHQIIASMRECRTQEFAIDAESKGVLERPETRSVDLDRFEAFCEANRIEWQDVVQHSVPLAGAKKLLGETALEKVICRKPGKYRVRIAAPLTDADRSLIEAIRKAEAEVRQQELRVSEARKKLSDENRELRDRLAALRGVVLPLLEQTD